MIEPVRGNLLEADAEALVNTVNTVGVMGKGVALQFRQAFPDNYTAYRRACRRGDVRMGRMFTVPTGRLTNPRYIINFPTKKHWRGRARLEDIEAGLEDLVRTIKALGIRSVAIPPLGCGNGGLVWKDVRPRIESALAVLPHVRILLYEPGDAPEPEKMRVGTAPPRMTLARATLIALLHKYVEPGYRLTLLEIQKLAYFMQVAGETLKLDFQKGSYGPYTETLHYVLQRMEGHFVRGYGDRSRSTAIGLLPGAIDKADELLQQYPQTRDRLERVGQLIEGFETPYGMELLATVHWVAQEDPAARGDVNTAVDRVYAWNERKRKLFQPEHVRKAWVRLRDEGWL